MDDTDSQAVFAICATQRWELADLLAGLTDAQLDTPSLCAGWSVRVVAAHLVGALRVPLRSFVGAVLRSGGSLDRANNMLAHRHAAEPVSTMAAALRSEAEKALSPPVTGPRGPMTDLLVHSGDMRLPLDLVFDPPTRAIEIALDFLTGRAPGFVPRRRLTGLAFAPIDSPRRWGTGPEITGRAADVMMAISGRTATLDRLAGPGVAILQQRL